MKTQSAEFDALSKLIDATKALSRTGIVDDDYPEMRHYYESALVTFFEACEANGRFSPRSRFGIRSPGVALLREAAEKFRFYQAQHEKKYRDIEAEIAKLDEGDDHFPLRTRLGETHEKARVNAEIATRIESYLCG